MSQDLAKTVAVVGLSVGIGALGYRLISKGTSNVQESGSQDLHTFAASTTEHITIVMPDLHFRSLTKGDVEFRIDPFMKIESRLNPARANRPKQGTDPNDTTFQKMIEGYEKKDPFGAAVIMKNVPKFQEKILNSINSKLVVDGRLILGDTVYFPNLNPFGENHAVGVMCKESFLPIDAFTLPMLTNCFKVSQEYMAAIFKMNGDNFPVLVWNYMPPSAGSLIHPHVQVLVEKNPVPELKSQLLSTALYFKTYGRCYFADYLDAEKQNKVRWIGSNESIDVFAPFSPRGFNQVNLVVRNCSNIPSMTQKQIADFADAVVRVLKGYKSIGIGSFNMASYSSTTYSSHESYWANFVFWSRPNPNGIYTNDTGPTERMYGNYVIDTFPEKVAEIMRPFFQ